MKRVWLQTRASPARTSEGEGWGGGREELERSLFIQPVLPGLIPPLPSFSIPSLFFSPPLPTSPLFSHSFPFPPFSPSPASCTPSPSTQQWDRRLECTPSLSSETCSTEVRVREVHRKDDSNPICWVVACGLWVLTGARVSNSVFY